MFIWRHMGHITIKPKSLNEIKIVAKEALGQAGVNFKSQVVAVFDVSGSMNTFYKSGIMEGLVTRILGLALHLDDNGEIPVYVLDSGVRRMPDLTEKNLGNYTLILHREVGGGTCYAPSIERVVQDAEPGDPMLVILFTDGDNSDHRAAKEAIINASKLPIFFQWYGIYQGHSIETFPFLEKLDTLGEREKDLRVDNCGFSPLGLSFEQNSNGGNEDDMALYMDMLKEYKDFPQKAALAGVKWENKQRRKLFGIF